MSPALDLTVTFGLKPRLWFITIEYTPFTGPVTWDSSHVWDSAICLSRIKLCATFQVFVWEAFGPQNLVVVVSK